MKAFASAGLVALLVFGSVGARAQSGAVFAHEVKAPFGDVYRGVYKAIEKAGYTIAEEIDMHKGIKSLSRELGDQYNRSQLEAAKSMIFCNGKYANTVSNLDPDMLALCPLHVTVLHRAGATRVLFARPSVPGKGSPAEATLEQVEDEVIAAIRAGAGN
jgi:uncharacterized protein (DUF302 family)